MNNSVDISIITVCLNNIVGLKKTVNSVIKQGYYSFELLIIDGLSTDQSQQYLESLVKNSNIKYVSEKDDGIYDAMNKGIELAHGKWIMFLNAGDYFPSKKILSSIDFKNENVELFLGNALVQYHSNFTRLKEVNDRSLYWKSLPTVHQSMIYKTSLAKQHPFNIKYKLCADYHQFISLLSKGVTNIEFIEKPISTITAGGVSDDKRYYATNEVYSISKLYNNLSIWQHLYFIIAIVWGYIAVHIKFLIPNKLISYITKLKYKN